MEKRCICTIPYSKHSRSIPRNLLNAFYWSSVSKLSKFIFHTFITLVENFQHKKRSTKIISLRCMKSFLIIIRVNKSLIFESEKWMERTSKFLLWMTKEKLFVMKNFYMSTDLLLRIELKWWCDEKVKWWIWKLKR